MGWEYRIFFRPDPSTPRVLNLKGRPEDRTDVYYVHSPGVGVKQRGGGGGGLEVKFMKDSDEDGFEKWEKYKTDDDEIEDLLAHHRRSPLPVNVPPVTLMKRRVQLSSGHKCLEETDIVLCFSDSGKPPVQEHWRSICIEGKRKQCLPQQQELLGQVKAILGVESGGGGAEEDDNNDVVMVCSYASFIAHAVARLWRDPSARNFIKGAKPPPPPSSKPPGHGAEDSMIGCGFDVLLGNPACK
jgi:hypothetical protein